MIPILIAIREMKLLPPPFPILPFPENYKHEVSYDEISQALREI